MIEALFNQPNYVATKRMMDATALRHEAIASNIANIETPNYKRVELAGTFQSELRQAIASGDPDRIAGTQPRLVEDATSISSRRDGNNVQLETELLNLNQNTLAHTLETQLITGSLLRMRLAITGRPS